MIGIIYVLCLIGLLWVFREEDIFWRSLFSVMGSLVVSLILGFVYLLLKDPIVTETTYQESDSVTIVKVKKEVPGVGGLWTISREE